MSKKLILFGILILLIPSLLKAQSLRDIHQKYLPQLDTISTDTLRIKKIISYALEVMNIDGDSGLVILDWAERESTKHQFTNGLGKVFSFRGVIANRKNELELALKHYEHSLVFFEKTNNEKEIGRQYYNMGIIYSYQGKLKEATEIFIKAAGYLEKIKDTTGLCAVYNGIGTSFASLEEFKKALDYYTIAEKMAAAHGDTATWVQTLHNKAPLNKEWEARLKDLRLALMLSQKKGLMAETGNTFKALGETYSAMSKPDSANYFFLKAEPILLQVDNNNYTTMVYQGLARNMNQTRNFKKGKEYAEKAIGYAEKNADLESIAASYFLLGESLEGIGMYKESLAAVRHEIKLLDSFRNQKNAAHINTLEVQYRTLQKDKQILDKQLAIDQQEIALQKKDMLIVIISGALLILVLGAILVYFHSRNKQDLQLQKLKLLQQEYELRATRAMMEGEERERERIARNLHDGAASMLSAAQLYVRTLAKQVHILPDLPVYNDTLTLLDEASTEIRETAHNLLPRILQQDGLHAAIENFCNKFDNQQNLAVSFQSYGLPVRYNRHFELLVYRTVQELINNSVKHANATEIMVQLSFDGDLFSVTVEDDGKGFDINSISGSQGMGISSLRQRMAVFNGNTDIQSSAEGTVVYISFELSPLLQMKEKKQLYPGDPSVLVDGQAAE
ncbi:MAG: tetratricopeptide repeat protein [Chitinophagaceae bacterium]|nr:tetratricopeptide repeat protein [Chitinophagaceae bacterium]